MKVTQPEPTPEKMISTVLSLNLGEPSTLAWNGQSVVSSMRRRPVAGPLHVTETGVAGNSFAAPHLHGDRNSVLYVYGLPSAQSFTAQLGRPQYDPGLTGETVTVDALDEKAVLVGDVYQLGSVVVQATGPRIPCGKVNLLMQSSDGQAAMQRCGRSGVYFRVLQGGQISMGDEMTRLSSPDASESLSIWELYARILDPKRVDASDLSRSTLVAILPERVIRRWEQALSSTP